MSFLKFCSWPVGAQAHPFLIAFGLRLASWSCVFSFAYSPFGSNTIWPTRCGLECQRSSNIDFRMIFVVLDLPDRVIPKRAVFCPRRSVGVIATRTPEIRWKGRLVDAYRTSPTFTITLLAALPSRGSR